MHNHEAGHVFNAAPSLMSPVEMAVYKTLLAVSLAVWLMYTLYWLLWVESLVWSCRFLEMAAV